MAKRARKEKTEAERAQIEADRLAAHQAVADTFDDGLLSPLQQTYLKELEEDLAETNKEELAAITESEIAEAIAAVPLEDEGEEERVPNSIVKDKFKTKYAENAAAIGDTRKQVKRSNWDWLSQQLATFCLSEKGKIDIGAFTDVLDANGVDHSKWTNRNKGWEGRFRMTGRVALQKVIANKGVLHFPGDALTDGEGVPVPTDFIERYKTKA